MKTAELKLFKWWNAGGWGLVLLVIFLSVIPSPEKTPSFQGADKLFHSLAYTVLMLWFGALHTSRGVRLRTGLALVFMGSALELIQGLLGYRTLSTADMAANALGILLGLLLCLTPLSGMFQLAESLILSDREIS